MTINNALVIIVGMLAGYLVLVALAYAALPFVHGASWLLSIIVTPFGQTGAQMGARTRRKSLDAEIERELGRGDPLGQQARADVVQAALDAQRIRVLDQMFRTTVRKCVSAHWSVAEGLGATHMSEAARHPICQGLRQRVIDLSEVLGDTIAQYPLLLDAPELVPLQVGVHRIAPTCIACPYWTSNVAQAPRLCPPARALGCGQEGTGAVVDAEVILGN